MAGDRSPVIGDRWPVIGRYFLNDLERPFIKRPTLAASDANLSDSSLVRYSSL